MGRTKKSDKEKIRYSKIIVAVVLGNTFLFSWAILLVFYFKGLEPVILIEWYFKIIVGELGLMALSKIFELWKGKGELNVNSTNSSGIYNPSYNGDNNLQDSSSGCADTQRETDLLNS